MYLRITTKTKINFVENQFYVDTYPVFQVFLVFPIAIENN